ncbi:MAG: DUF21 domain-containing protein [Rickettsiaceae bacterium]|nr:DUF21 domain-containing protein [Rickettsiaceae bacterium]
MFIIAVTSVIMLLIIGALLSATETAITAASPAIIQRLRKQGDKKANILYYLLKTKEKVISTLLIGNSICNTLCTTIATGIFIEIYGDDAGTIISSIVMSCSIIVFSEVIPKAIAVIKSSSIALKATPLLVILLKILEPINIALAYIVKSFCFIFRIDLRHKISAREEMIGVIEHHLHEGNVVKDDRDMLGGILNIRDMEISEIMTHRSKVTAINIDTPIEKIIKTIFESPHTRFPFWEGNPDNIIGILHIKVLVNKLYQVKNDLQKIKLKELLSAPVFIPDNALVIQQLHMLKTGQTHLACVVDEYGDLQGIFTLEDVLEEIVGQIYDEHDLNKHKITKLADNILIIGGETPIRDLNREMNLQIPEEDATTIAGFIIHNMEKIPNQGEYFIYQNLKMIVHKRTKNCIHSVKIIIQEEIEDSDDA